MLEKNQKGSLHPISQAIEDIVKIFYPLGFSVADGPEVESEENNFDLLNVPPDHPARDMWDTFWIDKDAGFVLRTHTSPVQVRYMKENTPPIRVIVTGKAFRYEATDATHESNFFQLEGLMIEKKGLVTMATLKGVLEHFIEKFFGADFDFRMRPGYFPFVEPGVEIDMKDANGKWIEVLGAGMVHPNVLRNVGIDPEEYSGFAFGAGIDRLVNLRYGIPDVRLSYQGDLRFVNQF